MITLRSNCISGSLNQTSFITKYRALFVTLAQNKFLRNFNVALVANIERDTLVH